MWRGGTMSGWCCIDSIFPAHCHAALKSPKSPLAAGAGRVHLHLLKFLQCVQITRPFSWKSWHMERQKLYGRETKLCYTEGKWWLGAIKVSQCLLQGWCYLYLGSFTLDRSLCWNITNCLGKSKWPRDTVRFFQCCHAAVMFIIRCLFPIS